MKWRSRRSVLKRESSRRATIVTSPFQVKALLMARTVADLVQSTTESHSVIWITMATATISKTIMTRLTSGTNTLGTRVAMETQVLCVQTCEIVTRLMECTIEETSTSEIIILAWKHPMCPLLNLIDRSPTPSTWCLCHPLAPLAANFRQLQASLQQLVSRLSSTMASIHCRRLYLQLQMVVVG